MTREQNFRSSFIPQFETYSSIGNIPRTSISKIPVSELPSFAIELGKTRYTAFDLTGKATAGEQEFTVSIYYTFALREIEYAYTAHSNMVDLIEQFINSPVYIPPGVLPGETYSIDRCKLVEAKTPSIGRNDTRYITSVTGKYFFTML